MHYINLHIEIRKRQWAVITKKRLQKGIMSFLNRIIMKQKPTNGMVMEVQSDRSMQMWQEMCSKSKIPFLECKHIFAENFEQIF